MCLFNKEIQGPKCGHEECKNFYSMTMEANQSSPSNVLKPTPTNIPKKSKAQTTKSEDTKTAKIPGTPSDISGKRSRTDVSESGGKDQHESPITKVVKVENAKNEVQAIKKEVDPQPSQIKMPEQNPPFGRPGDSNLLNNMILNNFLNPNGTIKPDALPKIPNSNILMSLFQNPNFSFPPQPKGINPPIGLSPMGSMNFSNLFLSNQGSKQGPLSVNGASSVGTDASMNLQQENMNASVMSVANLMNEMKNKTSEEGNGDGFLKEFQGRILNLLLTQNKMLVDLKEKNDVLQDALACLMNEINSINKTSKQPSSSRATNGTTGTASHQFLGNNSEVVSVENLISFLYGPSPDFQYQLILKSDLPLPLYRERNFKFTVVLTDKNGNTVENSNRIPLTIGLYSSENPPKYIEANTAGNKILKGLIEKDLTNGSVTFDKIQIKEVTSHFRNGWIFFVVYPKINASTSGNPLLMGTSSGFIHSQKIKPLILEKVIVKAKKAKEKEAGDEKADNDENTETKNDDGANDENASSEK